ncbi:MAG TPA: family 16 glycosylhydrolase, partial [Candidatus Angelobacter sp.]|nr:family 16 glycosylhydrolase [Candidatus Angelobacter sp.]
MHQKLSLLALSFLLVGSFALPKTYAATSTQKQPTVNEVLAFNPVAVKGKIHGTTRVVAKVPNSDEHLVIKISNTPLKASAGDAAPTGGTVTNPYESNTDLSGADDKINKYLGVYLVDDKNKIVTFKQLALDENQVQKDNWDVVWEDNFSGNTIDSSKWNFVQGGGGYGNNELEDYTNRPQNARVEDGHLVIQAQKENYQGSDYTSAKLTTEGKGDWTYGRYEIRAKLPKGQGMWPAIWMMPTDYNLYSAWPASGEIDIMELLG